MRVILTPKKILVFDTESIAAGFADPQWVPQKLTAAAWSFVGSDHIEVRTCTPDGLFGKVGRRKKMVQDLCTALNDADLLVGHNIIRHDLPVTQAESWRLDLPTIGPFQVLDTIKLFKSKGYKKSQDDISTQLGNPFPKKHMGWQDWEDAYATEGWPEIKERVMGDVMQNKWQLAEQIERGMLRGVTTWRP